MDYLRVWSVVRSLDQQLADLPNYDTNMHYGVEFLALFDEGPTYYAERSDGLTIAKMARNDTVVDITGYLTPEGLQYKDEWAEWVLSDIPTTKILVPANLPAVVNETWAVEKCVEKLNQHPFNTVCLNFTSIEQLFLERCIADLIRTQDEFFVNLAFNAYAFYCH